MTQQQLLMLNAFSNRLTSLFNDVTKYGVPIQVLQPHMTTLRRMISSSRDIQCRLQSFSRKHPPADGSAITPESCLSTQSIADLQEAEKEKTRLREELDVLNGKLKFFSAEYQRITQLYLQEKEANEKLEKNTTEDTPSTVNLEELWELDQEMMNRMEERERTQQKLQNIRAQAKELEYALKRLLETGTVISPELDEQIQKVISNQNLTSVDE